MKHLIALISLFLLANFVSAQNTIESRIIFIGDAGEINFKQETIIPRAADLIIADKTTVLFLGDNIYPHGMGLPGSEEEEETKEILRSQFEPMRAKGVPVYFVPGNHDWDRMGKQGLAKIKAQGAFLEAQQDSLLKLIPANGCPGPVEIPVSDNTVIIAYDSEWWLFPYEKYDPNSDCECNSEKELIEKLEELLYKNRDKTIFLASHHPFQSYGVHGGYYSWKDHIFPLTNINKNLLIPLPVIGSLYPLLRTTVFLNPEDMPHPDYKRLIKEVSGVFEGFPNVIYVAGHEHGLQFIKNEDKYQIVSGSGAKSTNVQKGKNLLYGHSMQGFVTVDMMDDRSTQITYYSYADGGIKEEFNYHIPYHKEELVNNKFLGKEIDTDSVIIQANAAFDKVSSFHRMLFGENYRKEWAAETKVPVIRVAEVQGGLTPIKRGGGMQTTSIRLKDKTGKQWLLRSVNKSSVALLPSTLSNTFVRDFFDDAVSAQHPYSTLMVPPIAHAVKVPATNPIIGIVAPDTALREYNALLANKLNLLEEREPLGKSDNTIKMLEKVYNDNDDTFGARTFLRSRILDLLIGDWDRHEDQYRWADQNTGKDKDYTVVPRDRDQVVRLMDGLIPNLVSRSWIAPSNQGFSPKIKHVDFFMMKSAFLNSHPKMQFSYGQWMKSTDEFVNNVTDSVLEESLKRLPRSSYELRHEQLLSDLKQRRDAIPEAMDKHYRFINSIVDIRLSNKNEKVTIEDAPENAIRVVVRKINKEGEIKKVLMDKVYKPAFTKEVRIYLSAGNDNVEINTSQSEIKLRIVGGGGNKSYHVEKAKNKIKLYDLGKNSTYSGNTNKLRKHIASDSTHTSFVPVNLYNVTMPLITAGYNIDDGIILGAGFKYTHQRGFRKTPFTYTQQLLVSGSFATGSFKIDYKGHWKEAIGKADFIVDAHVRAPNNTQNFFGLGNSSEYDDDNSIKYYRARFNLYELEPALQWNKRESIFKVGPALQYYSFDPTKNEGRFVNNNNELHTYDSLTVDRDKAFVGIITEFIKDNRNSTLLPTSGGYFNARIKAYTGLNDFSKSFAQLTSEIALYHGFANNAVVLANRTGGGVTVGKTTFYQSLFLGGGDNLLGTRKYRYAGEHLFYNNLETRIKLAEVGSYILPGQLGLVGFYDVGKTWAKNYNSKTIHQSVGGGVYYSPAQMAIFQFVAGHSKEGWYPHLTMGFRF